MIGLTDSQFEQLEQKLKSAGIQREGLYNDLLDHYYCLTEAYVANGFDFEMAAEKAIQELAPEGFESIEQELIFLLTFKFQTSMNRLLYSGAFAAAFGLTFFVLFRMFLWPGVSIFLMVADFSLLFVVVPVMLIQLRQNSAQLSSTTRFRILFGLMAIGLFGLGSMFKIMYWPGASALIIVGTVTLGLIFLPLFFWQEYQKSVRPITI